MKIVPPTSASASARAGALMVKVLDGCGRPGRRYRVFAAGLTDVGVDLTVTDTQADVSKSYRSPPGATFQPILDTAAFATCP